MELCSLRFLRTTIRYNRASLVKVDIEPNEKLQIRIIPGYDLSAFLIRLHSANTKTNCPLEINLEAEWISCFCCLVNRDA